MSKIKIKFIDKSNDLLIVKHLKNWTELIEQEKNKEKCSSVPVQDYDIKIIFK